MPSSQADSSALPRVSILIAARDAGDTLSASLASVSRQSFTDWECVVVDDGSQVPIPAPADPRFRVLLTEPQGPAEARNAGLRECRGELVALLDADDLMRRERLALQVAALDANPDWVGVGSHARYFPRRRLRDGMRRYEAWLASVRAPADVRRDAWIEMPVGHPTLMLRGAALRAAGGWRDRGWPEDWDLFLRLVVERGGSIGVVPRRLLAWRVRANSVSRTSPAYTLDAFRRCRAAFLADVFLAEADEYTLWGHGPTGRALAAALREHGKRPTAIVEVHPRRLGASIRGAPVVPPEALADLPRRPLIAAVSGSDARAKIRAHLGGLGWNEGVDFVCAA